MTPEDVILFSLLDDDEAPPRAPGERLRWSRDRLGREMWERVIDEEQERLEPPRGDEGG